MRWLPGVVAVLTVLAACGGGDTPGGADTRDDFKGGDDRLKVATTVAPLTNIVLNVGGTCIRIHGLIPAGVDSHTYEPRPSDAAILSRADLLIMNGAELEGTTEAMAEASLKSPKHIYRLADNTLRGDDPATGFLYDFSFPRSAGRPNPHLWMDPVYALKYAELTRDWLSELDPARAACFRENYDRLAMVLNQLNAAIAEDQATVPEANRRLLTYHDSWAYWARRYGWGVVGAVQPNDFSEPSAREVAGLIQQLKREKLPAIFGSEVFPSQVMETIAAETGAAFEDRLRDDEPPGKPGEQGHTYVGMVVEDMKILFTRLGGRASAVTRVPVEDTYAR